MAANRMEIMWGVRLLDEGFTPLPNLLVRNYRKLSIEHGEWGLICQILTYRHDSRDPYPSRDELADHLCCSWRQIEKWVASLKAKGLLKTGRRRNAHNKQWDNRVFNFKPLLDAVLTLVGEQILPPTPEEYEIIWDDENEPCVPEVHVGLTPEVHVGLVPEVHTKNKIKKENLKELIDCMGAAAEIATAADPDPIYEALNKFVPSNCYVDNVPLSEGYINDIYLMLITNDKFINCLDPEIVKIACELYFERACEIRSPQGVVMKLNIDNPVGFYGSCYDAAVKLYKVTRDRKRIV
jgi:hypothetical protein